MRRLNDSSMVQHTMYDVLTESVHYTASLSHDIDTDFKVKARTDLVLQPSANVHQSHYR